MSDIGVAEIPVTAPDERALSRLVLAAANPLLDRPILGTLLRLSAPNVVALGAGTCVVIAETSYIGRLGTEALAAMAAGDAEGLAAAIAQDIGQGVGHVRLALAEGAF